MVNVSRPEDRRSAPRYAARFDVRFYSSQAAARAFNAFSVNFSAGGLCVRSRQAYAVGDPLKLELRIEGVLFELDAVVAWVRGEAVGVRFVDVPDDMRAKLEAVAKGLAAKGPALE